MLLYYETDWSCISQTEFSKYFYSQRGVAILDYFRHESYVIGRVTQTFQSVMQSSLRNQNHILVFISNTIFIGNIGLNEMK